jgi:alkylation response protein AidB-like acyl-CoA dehydrogenase
MGPYAQPFIEDALHDGYDEPPVVAKYNTGRIGALVAEECIQLHGGISMTWERITPSASS